MREFKSAQLKIDRAIHHVDDLDARRRAFIDTQPCKVKAKYNTKTGSTDYVVENIVPVDPIISLIIGDIIHNLRSALDHLAAALVHDNGGTVTNQTYFPILQDFPRYKSQSAGKINGVSLADKSLIDSFKPYLGGNDALWGLHKMDITDKHSLILTQTNCVSGIDYRVSDADIAETFGPGFFDDSPSQEKQPVNIPLLDPIPIPKKGDVLLSFPGNTEENEDMKPSFDIAFGNVEVFAGRLVQRSVFELAQLVQRIVKAFA